MKLKKFQACSGHVTVAYVPTSSGESHTDAYRRPDGGGVAATSVQGRDMTSLINSKFAVLAEKQAKEDKLWNCDPRDQGKRTF